MFATMVRKTFSYEECRRLRDWTREHIDSARIGEREKQDWADRCTVELLRAEIQRKEAAKVWR